MDVGQNQHQTIKYDLCQINNMYIMYFKALMLVLKGNETVSVYGEHQWSLLEAVS